MTATGATLRPEPAHFKHWPPGVPRHLTVPETSMWFNLEVTAARYPDRAATVYYGETLTWRQIKQQAEALAGWLQEVAGVQRGDRVLLDLQNCPQWMIAWYAIVRADAVVVPVSPMLVTAELAHFVTDSGAQLAVVGQELLSRVLPLRDKGLRHILAVRYGDALPGAGAADAQDPSLRAPDFVRAPWVDFGPDASWVTRWSDSLSAGLTPVAHRCGADDLIVLPYTSGTTGKPKGCMHTHRTLMSTTLGVCAFGNAMYADSVVLSVMPFFHITGMQVVMNASVFSGSTQIMMTRWDRETAAVLIPRYKINTWINISTMVIDFLAMPGVESIDLSSLTRVNGGGAAMPAAVAQKLFDLTGLSYIEGYGLTETAAPSHSNPTNNPKKQCLGIPFFDVDSRVVDPDTLQELPQGQVGEILIHGPQVFLGYWQDEAKSRSVFVDIDGKRFFRSGDLGYIDDDGYFFYTDRLKRMINASGMKVWPAEVEAKMFEHPAVQECCIIGSRDAYRGETVKAVIVLRPGASASADEIMSWAREHMAAYKAPKVIEFVEALPRSATGKVMWRALQEKEMQS